MSKLLYCIVGILIPFIGTSLGSSFVFFLRKKLNKNIEKLLIGFAIGVMLAASNWSLLIPSIEMAEEMNIIKWIPASIGFALGILFLIIINKITDKLDNKKIDMLMFSVTIHNIPEGMAVGVIFAGFLSVVSNVPLLEAMALSIGIALQNIPEGAIISLPYKLKGNKKIKSFIYGVLSGIVEPIFAFITIILLNLVVPLLPYLLSFAAGAMIYVVIEELVPEIEENLLGIIGVCIGFDIMMILDVVL